jgi:hypothetical protein
VRKCNRGGRSSHPFSGSVFLVGSVPVRDLLLCAKHLFVAATCEAGNGSVQEELAASRSLETIHFGPEYCGRALSVEEWDGEWGDGNERTGDEASSRRERSETADGRRNQGHGKGSGSHREGSLKGRGGHYRDGTHADLIARPRCLLHPRKRTNKQTSRDVRFVPIVLKKSPKRNCGIRI